MMRNAFLIVICLGLKACATSTVWTEDAVSDGHLQRVDPALFATVPDLPEPEELLNLSPEVKNDFFAFYNKPEFALHTDIERVGTYLTMLVEQFTYSESTLTAQQALDAQSGNCLSLTLVTTAIAKLAGVSVSYDLLDSNPTFSLKNNVLISTDHMRGVLQTRFNPDPANPQKTLTKRITIDYFRSGTASYIKNVSTDFQLSLYYSNHASERLAEGDFNSAFHYAKKALDIYQQNPSALNTLAIVHTRIGMIDIAQSIYQQAIDANNKYSPLFYRNYLSLLKREGLTQEMERVASQYQHLQQSHHPLKWINKGRHAHANGNYYRAIEHYQRALKLAPNTRGLYLLMAQSSIAGGDMDEASKFLRRASANASDDHESRRFNRKLAKLDAFSSNSKPAGSRPVLP